MSDDRPRGFRRLFRLPLTRSRVERQLDDELHFHIDERIREFHARGMTPEQAEAEARRRFGDYDAYRREARTIDETTIRQRSRLEVIDTIRRETRHAIATLIRSPAFSAIAFLTLALGLGAATTIFTLLDRVVLRPLPYPNAERLVHIGTLWPFVRVDAEFKISRGQFFYFKEHTRTLADIGLYDGDMIPVPGDGDHEAERVPMLLTSPSLFHVLGITPARGRIFTPEEAVSRQPTVALISHEYWTRRYGADPAIVGKHIVIGPDRFVQIIGVLPPGAAVPDFKADIWAPNWLDPAAHPQNNHTHAAIGLAKADVSMEEIDRDLKSMEKQFEAAYPDVYPPRFIERGFAITQRWLQDEIVGDRVTRALWIVFAGVIFVLLIAAANVANLFLVRIDARRREVAVRAALGAGRRELATQFLTESAVLGLASALGAVALTYALLHVVVTVAPPTLPRLEEVALDWRGVAFCFGIALACAIVFGILPLASARLDVTSLREGGRGLLTSHGRNLARRALVVSQVALAVVLFAGAALMVRSYAHLRDVRPGFEPAGVQTVGVTLPPSRYRGYLPTTVFWHQLIDRVTAIPGVTGAGAVEQLPLVGESGCTAIGIDFARNSENRGGCVHTVLTTPGYFSAMGIRVRGDTMTWSGVETGQSPAIVSAMYAAKYFPDEEAIGHRVRVNGNICPWSTIVGVAEDVRVNGLQQPSVPMVYLPVMQGGSGGCQDWASALSIVVRAPANDLAQTARAVRRAAIELDRQVPIDAIQPMEAIVAKSTAQTSFTMTLLLISACFALVLSAVGLYGVISYLVSLRRGEIGIRIALGARMPEVTGMVLRQSLSLALGGVVVGVVIAALGTKLMQSLLFEVSPNDPVVLAVTSVVLLVVAALASVAPARRAALVDPVEALRAT